MLGNKIVALNLTFLFLNLPIVIVNFLITYYQKYIGYLPYIYRLVFDHTSRSGRVLNIPIEQKMLNSIQSASNRCKQAQNEKRKNVAERQKK